MPTPKSGYFLKDGTKVPGTTTVIGRFKDSGGLLHWAFRQGKEGKERLYDEAEKAAGIGTVAHSMVEMHVKGTTEEAIENHVKDVLHSQEEINAALSAFKAYLSWEKNFKVIVIEQEILLVSEKYRYGGTPDAIGLIDNQLVLLDWKTSNSVYTDHLIQLAAYGNLWAENNPDRPITGGFHLLRFAKEHGDFAHHYFPQLDNAWRQFILFREAYEIDRELKKRAA